MLWHTTTLISYTNILIVSEQAYRNCFKLPSASQEYITWTGETAQNLHFGIDIKAIFENKEQKLCNIELLKVHFPHLTISSG